MSDSPRPNLTPSLIPGPSLESPAAVFLREEHAVAAPGAAKSVLLHELGVLEEHAADEMGAAREYLAAFNANPQFREPLEGLLRLLERRKSVKNLPKLLDALLRVAETPEERARALRKRAAFYDDVKSDTVTARQALETAGAEDEADPSAWLALEVLAGKISEPELRAKALDERANRASDPSWRGLLLLAAAELAIKRTDIEGAFARLEQARDLDGAARWPSLVTLERLAAREVREGVLPTALEAQANLIEQAMASPEQGDRFGVPRSVRTPVAAADALLRAADARRREGDLQSAASLLERALALAGMLPIVVAARLSVAESLGDTATADRMAQALLGQQVGARARASLWMRVAEAAASREDVHGALSALNEALKADPACVPARALQIDLLGSANDPGGLAGALESMAAELPTDEGRGRTYLLSAYVYAIEAADLAGAKAALSQAGVAQVSALTLARVSKLLASATGDGAWYDDALRRLLVSGVGDKERLSVWYELGRTRLLRGDEEGAGKAFDALAGLPGGGWLGRALGAYALGLHAREKAKDSGGHDTEPTLRVRAAPGPLDELRRAESDGAFRRALALAAVRRAERMGETDGVQSRLRELLAEDPNDLVAAAYLSEVERRAGRPVEAAKVLLSAAEGAAPAELATALYIEAGILFFRANERAAAIDAFGAATNASSPSATLLLAWALRGSTGADAATAAARLERAADLGEDSALVALQRAALELAALRPDAGATTSLLQGAEQAEVSEVGVAAALARLLVGTTSPDIDGLTRALDRLDVESEQAATVVSFERQRVARAGRDCAAACTAGRKLADSAACLPAALEWLGSAWAAEDRGADAEARRRVARYLPPESQAAVEASAAMVAFVDHPMGSHAFVDSPEPAARCMNLELAPPGSAPERRAEALQAFGDLLPDDGSKLDAAVMAGYNLLGHGNAQAALDVFAKVVEQRDTICSRGRAYGAPQSRSARRNTRPRPVRALENCARTSDVPRNSWRTRAVCTRPS